jgi:hypothetical protein
MGRKEEKKIVIFIGNKHKKEEWVMICYAGLLIYQW